MPGTLKKILRLLFLLFFVTLWSSFMFVRMIIDIIRYRGAFFAKKSRPSPPKEITEGWDHGYINVQDIKLHYVQAGSREKPLMLMLHGFPEFWYSWRHQIREFSRDYRVVAVDMRGYGDSDKPSGLDQYKIRMMVTDIRNLIPSLGYNSCVLVAHDWGGAIGWQIVLQYPELVDKFVICNCPHPLAFRQGGFKQLLMSWYMFAFQVPFLPEFYLGSRDLGFLEEVFTDPQKGGARNPDAFTKGDIEAYKYTFGHPGALTPPLNYYRAAFQRQEHDPPKDGSFEAEPPTLIIWGTRDIALSTELAALSLKHCRAGTLKYVEGSSHWVQQDQPDTVNRLMREFLSG